MVAPESLTTFVGRLVYDRDGTAYLRAAEKREGSPLSEVRIIPIPREEARKLLATELSFLGVSRISTFYNNPHPVNHPRDRSCS